MDRLQANIGITTYSVAIFQLFRVALHILPNERVSHIWKWIKVCNRWMFILVINKIDAQNLFYNKFISCQYMFRAPYARRQEVKIVLYSLWYYHTCRWPSRARDGCIIQFWPPDDEHVVLETCIGMK